MTTKIVWTTESEDRERYKSLVKAYANHPLVLNRVDKNVNRGGLSVNKQTFWSALIGCLITTQQRSGPGTSAQSFIDSGHDILQFDKCADKKKFKSYVEIELQNAGLRRYKVIAKEASGARRVLNDKSWKDIRTSLTEVKKSPSVQSERKAARLLQRSFSGIGPKQSRNLLQWMGLSQFEIPLDSRVAKVLMELGFPIPVKPKLLADEDYYAFVLDGLQSILRELDVLPCVFDGAAFASRQ